MADDSKSELFIKVQEYLDAIKPPTWVLPNQVNPCAEVELPLVIESPAQSKPSDAVSSTVPSEAWFTIVSSGGVPSSTFTTNSNYYTSTSLVYDQGLNMWQAIGNADFCACGMAAVFKSPKLLCKNCWVTWFVKTVGEQKDLSDKAIHELRERTKAAIVSF